jgi:hypothetical protein
MSNILTGFNMQGNDPIDDRIVSKSNLETLEQYLKRVPVQKRYYGLTFFALDKNNELRKYTFQTSLIEPTIDDDKEEIKRIDKELQEHVSNKAIHKTSEEIRSEIVDADIPDTIARVQWTLDQINTAVINLIGGASDEYNTLKRIQTKIEELRAKIYGDDGGEVLKTLEQALKFLNQYKDFIVDIPDNFVSKQDIVDNLTTDDPTKVLSAKQGKVLSDTLTNYFESAMQSIRTETDRAINAENRIEAKLDKEIERSTNEDIRIDNKLDSEINRSTAEDDRLDKKIDAETTRATTAESNLNTKIETETDRAEGEESRIETKLDNEIARSTNKDTEHDNRLTALEGDTHEQNTDLGTTNSTFQLKYNTGNKIKHESDAISVRNAADTDYVNFIAKNATFKGDLLVEGQSFVTEAETVEIKDNLLLLNKGEVGAGVTKGIAGLEIDRGTEPNYFIIFDESDNRFKAGVEGDLWNLALRESDDNMLDGYFISWNSKDKILSTTNIVNESTPLLFGRTDYKQYSGNRTDPDGNYSSYAFISEAEGNHLYNFSGSSNWNIDTDKINFRFWKPLLGTTFKRASDNSEVLYHADIVNNLTSGGTNKVLSAEQGKLLQNSITSIQGSYLPLSGGTLTGQVTIKQSVDIKLRLQSTDTDNYCIIQAINSQASQLGVFGYAGDKWAIGHSRTYYEIWDKYNLSNPVRYTLNDVKNPTFLDNEGNIFLYIKAGSNGILPNTSVSLSSGGTGTCGNNEWAFRDGYIANIYTNKLNFGTSCNITANDTSFNFITNNGVAHKIASGSLYIGSNFKEALLALVPTNGIYSIGNIKTESAILFTNNTWSNDLVPDRTHNGYLQVLDAYYDAANVGGPTNYGTVLQINSRIDHWANQLWFGNNDNMYLRRMNYGSTTYGKWNRLLTNKDVNILSASYKNDPNSLPINQIFYAETHDVTGTPTDNGLLFSVQGNDEGIQLWAGANRTELYYRTKWTSYGGWIKLAATSDLNSYLTKTEASTLYYPYNGRGYLSITSTGKPVMSNNQGYAVKDKDGNEREVLWMGTNNALYLGNTSQYTLGQLDLRCTTLTHNGNKIATQNYVTNQLSNYLPLTGGTISSSKSNPLTINSTHASQSSIDFNRGGVNKGTVGFYESLGSFLQNVTGETLAVKSDGAYYGANTNSLRKLATVTDLGSYLPLTGGNLTGKLSIKSSDSNLLILDSSSSTESVIHFLRSSTLKGAVGYYDNIGAFIYNFPSNTYLFVKDDGKPYVGTRTNYKKILTETDITGYATQTWSNSQYPLKTGTGASGTWDINISGNASTASAASKLGSTTIGGSAKPIYLSSGTPTACSATVGSATVPVYMNAGTITQCSTTLGVSITGNAATATNATQLGGTAASSYVKANDNISRLTNDSGYTTQEWVNGQGFLTSDSILDKFVPTTGGYIRNSDQVLLRLQRTGVSTGTSRTIEMYFDDSNADGTSTTPRGSIGYNSEVGMFLYSAKSKKFLAIENTGRPFYGTPENRYYLLGSNTQYHNLDGYQRIGDIMIQWGYFTVQGNSTRAVNFPVSFTNTVWSVTGSWDNTTTGNQENWGFTDYTSSGFTIINGDGSSRVFHYIAIGPFTRS